MKCRGCKKISKNIFLNLGSTPPSNAFLKFEKKKEKKYPLKIFFCKHCFLVQTKDFAKRDELFNKDYVYFSGYADTWKKHLKNFVNKIEKKKIINKNSFIVELASNDGSLQEILEKKNYECLGIEPTESTANVAIQKGFKVIKNSLG